MSTWRAPSMKMLMGTEFGNERMTEEDAKKIRSLIHNGKPIAALRHFDQCMHMCGLEGINDEDDNTVFMYANTGATYASTLVYNRVSQNVYISSCGAVVERNERRYRLR